jgi:hypothetical protein
MCMAVPLCYIHISSQKAGQHVLHPRLSRFPKPNHVCTMTSLGQRINYARLACTYDDDIKLQVYFKL